MSIRNYYTDEQKAELLSNPYTARVSACKVTFNLAFKQLVMANIDTPGMTSGKVFELAGYRKGVLTPDVMRYTVRMIRKEAASVDGLQEAKVIKKQSVRKKHSETEFKELQERVLLLEQQVNFLKKSQLLKNKRTSKPPVSSD